MTASCSLLAFVALVGGLPAPATTATKSRACSDPCVQAARAEYRDCTSSASGAFAEAIDGCLARDHECVDACRSEHRDCRDGTGVGAELARCALEVSVAKDECRNRFRLGSTRRVVCLFRAQVEGFRCRRGVRRNVRRDFVQCRAAFHQCAGACAPGAPPGGVGPCRTDGRTAFKGVLSSCRRTLSVAVNGCLEKDLTCGQDCTDAREACSAPTQATLDAALKACAAQSVAAVAACQQANPGGGTARDQCITAAQAAAQVCSEQAVEAAKPGLADCAGQYARCVRACPAA